MNPREFAERSLLGILLSQPGRVTQMATWLDPDDFHSPSAAAIYGTIRDMVRDAEQRVEWGTFPVHADDGSGLMPWPTPAEQAFRDIEGMLDNLAEGRTDRDTRQRQIDATAEDMAKYPGMIKRFTRTEQETLNRLLPRAAVDPYQVPGVDPITVYDRMASSDELGTSTVTAPGLHTLMETAPADLRHAQPVEYGLMVVEASIRRDVEQNGMRVGQISEATPDLEHMLAAVEAALHEVDQAQQRWESVTGRSSTVLGLLGETGPAESIEDRAGELAEATRLELPTLVEAPTPEELADAERGLLAAVLQRPALLDEIADRVLPRDFADPAVATSYRAAVAVHAETRTTGRRVDPVAVAWEQQRHQAQHGPGLSPDQLLGITQGPEKPLFSPEHHADLVMRGSLARLTHDAAESVQKAAQHPGLQPADLLHTTHMAYQAVQETAARMTGSNTARLAGLSAPVSIGDALRGGTGTTGPVVSPRPTAPREQGAER